MNLPNYETLKTELVEPHVLLVTLNRPAAANAFNTQMGRDFLDLWTRLTEDAGEVRCAVLTGAGEKVFCAGADLKERKGQDQQNDRDEPDSDPDHQRPLAPAGHARSPTRSPSNPEGRITSTRISTTNANTSW